MKSKEWLILNSVKAWLINYDDGLESELTEQYRELNKELYNAFITNDTPIQKRGRPAKKARTKKASSTEASKEKVETP
jgi:hypothetical protein